MALFGFSQTPLVGKSHKHADQNEENDSNPTGTCGEYRFESVTGCPL
jgi:hypothetical protein